MAVNGINSIKNKADKKGKKHEEESIQNSRNLLLSL